jgi:hypothetical protein
MIPSGGSIPGEDARALVYGEPHDDPLEDGGEKICAGEGNNRHPHHGKVEQPVAHGQPVAIETRVALEASLAG